MTKKISNFNGVSPSELFKPNSRRNHPPNLNRRNRLHRIIVLQSPPPPDVIAEKQLTIPGGAFQLPSPGDPRHCSPQKPGPTAGNFRSLHLSLLRFASVEATSKSPMKKRILSRIPRQDLSSSRSPSDRNSLFELKGRKLVCPFFCLLDPRCLWISPW